MKSWEEMVERTDKAVANLEKLLAADDGSKPERARRIRKALERLKGQQDGLDARWEYD